MTKKIQSIFVTGATGNVGKPFVKHAQKLGARIRVGIRNPNHAADFHEIGVETTVFDFLNPDTYFSALEGVHGVFLIRPPSISKVKSTLNLLIDTAISSGVDHIVFLSVAGAERAKFIPHAKVEDHLRRSGTNWTFLRAGFFAQNLGDAYRQDINEEDKIVLPSGKGRASFVDVRDVAKVAADALVNGTQKGAALELVGPEMLGFDQVAQILSEELGRRISYLPISVPRYIGRLRSRGESWGQAVVKAALHGGLRFGQGEGDPTTLETLLGQSPTSLRTYIRDHRNLWMEMKRANVSSQ